MRRNHLPFLLLFYHHVYSVIAFSPSFYRKDFPAATLTRRSALSEDSAFSPPPISAGSADPTNDESSLSEKDVSLLSRITSSPSLSSGIMADLNEITPAFLSRLDNAANAPLPSSIPYTAEELRLVHNAILSERETIMTMGKETLKMLLKTGEIRKLDAQIGEMMRLGRLDAAFFSVLSLNLRQAAEEEQERPGSGEGGDEDGDGEDDQPPGLLQIMQHVYTRCVEEVEKAAPPGPALLNKLLRTDVKGIRRNQLLHYLGPQKTSITSPDGTTIELDTANAKPLVALPDFLDAITAAVAQVRTLERAGGTGREAAANIVEQCRDVAKEARNVLGEVYGGSSKELADFEGGLQPVFRPGTTIESIQR
mmetsp:Transcript_25329/g.50451  ORF Transcript_25329/g.50451 Transcript_25329/m.50451 type:complete len:366 (-) Transcript_25329:164-1261(-)|eukprot:CAMPEP_0194306974 /NCGR_PEP_ID=MMETSP0171-20130528/3905_1 /TAXON_ID=218684 /ORGANISM="Corethron pennatum, Strain L29A3" /LENGTH=365 /DNA_ID=CAMNT_0039058841 /DNA_START=20 /DNA_END=1120 /DNA_ORIENTATION=+